MKVQNKSQIPEMRGSRGDVATPACDLNAMSKSLSISAKPPALKLWPGPTLWKCRLADLVPKNHPKQT